MTLKLKKLNNREYINHTDFPFTLTCNMVNKSPARSEHIGENSSKGQGNQRLSDLALNNRNNY